MRREITLLIGALSGCAEPLDSVSLDFRAAPLGAEELSEWSVAGLESGDHRVTVRHAAQAARSCEDLEAELMRMSHDLTLRIRDSGEGGGDGQPCGYTAVIHHLPSGRYTLRVVHSGSTRRPGAPVMVNQPLHIP